MDEDQIVNVDSESKKPSKLLTLIAVVFLVLVGGYLYLNKSKSSQKMQDNNVNTVSQKPANRVIVTDYSPGDVVNVNLVILSEPGFVVVYDDNEGQPGEVLGSSTLIQAGESEGVTVNLEEAVVEGQSLYVQLHKDNGDGDFDQMVDAAVTDDEGSPVVASYLVGADSDGSD